MKKILIIILVLPMISCKAQTIYNFGTDPSDMIASSYYIKDLDNHHDAIVGTWSWQALGQSFIMTLQEFEMVANPINNNLMSDRIYGKYSYSQSGNVISEVNQIYGSPLNFYLYFSFRTPTYYEAVIKDIYSGHVWIGDFTITSPNTATLKFYRSQGVKMGTNNGLEFSLPTFTMTMTKQ